MTKTKSTKRALLMSTLSLLMCVSMLIGSTFAWFTDSVTSTNNIIQSGNLDVELEYYDGDSWEKVTATTNVFEENTLWEPGHTETVYLKVSNLGTLALKYNLGINIVSEIESINVAGEKLRLSDYIEFGVIEDVETPYADRDAARAAITDSTVLSTGYTKAGSIEAGADAQYVALVVYMPETVGNEANYRTGEVAPQIELGINLMATQYTSEEDSFDNQYDADAKFDGVPAAGTTVVSKMPVVQSILTSNFYTLDAAYVFNTTETYEQAQQNEYRYWHADFVATFDQDVDGADVGLAGQYDSFLADWLAFELDGMTIAANTPVRMLYNEEIGTEIFMNYEELCSIVKKFQCGTFAVDQAAMDGKTMTVELRLYETTIDPNANSGSANIETGEYITIGSYSYTFGAKKITGLDELETAIAKGGNYILTADINDVDANTAVTIPAGVDVTLDLNGHKISATADKTGNQELFLVKGEMTVKNGSLEFVAENNQGWNSMATLFDVTAGGVLNMEGVTAEVSGTDMNFIAHLNNWGTATLNVNNCDFTTTYVAVRAFNSGYDMNTITIENTDFHGGRMFWVHNYTAEGKDNSTLNLNIYGNNNTSDNAKPVRFGFSNSTYYDLSGNVIE